MRNAKRWRNFWSFNTKRYFYFPLGSESHDPGPCILSGKTGHDLPVLQLVSPISPDIFAAFTGPDGGLTSLASNGDDHDTNGASSSSGGGCRSRRGRAGGNGVAPDAAEDSEDFDFIDLDDLGGSKSRRSSSEEEENEEADSSEGEKEFFLSRA